VALVLEITNVRFARSIEMIKRKRKVMERWLSKLGFGEAALYSSVGSGISVVVDFWV
jgi:hypothetical protein